MRNPTVRIQHNRAGLHHGSDMADAECALPVPLQPVAAAYGRRHAWRMRAVTDVTFSVLRAGSPR